MAVQHNTRSSLGILLLHGFTGTLDTVKPLQAPLEQLGVPVVMPLLAGHGMPSPEALCGVGWHEWLKDADKAFLQLSLEAERILVIGHSMGALLALNLAVMHKDRLDALVLATPPLKLFSPLAPGRPMNFCAPLISRLIKNWKLKTLFAEQERAAGNLHYAWVPTTAILSFFQLIKHTLPLLGRVTHPVLVLQCRRESTVHPDSAILLCNTIQTESSLKSILWLEHSEHQIFCDGERQTAIEAITAYVSGRMAGV